MFSYCMIVLQYDAEFLNSDIATKGLIDQDICGR